MKTLEKSKPRIANGANRVRVELQLHHDLDRGSAFIELGEDLRRDVAVVHLGVDLLPFCFDFRLDRLHFGSPRLLFWHVIDLGRKPGDLAQLVFVVPMPARLRIDLKRIDLVLFTTSKFDMGDPQNFGCSCPSDKFLPRSDFEDRRGIVASVRGHNLAGYKCRVPHAKKACLPRIL